MIQLLVLIGFSDASEFQLDTVLTHNKKYPIEDPSVEFTDLASFVFPSHGFLIHTVLTRGTEWTKNAWLVKMCILFINDTKCSCQIHAVILYGVTALFNLGQLHYSIQDNCIIPYRIAVLFQMGQLHYSIWGNCIISYEITALYHMG